MLTHVRDPEPLDPGSRVSPFVFLALTWIVGTMVHNRQRLAVTLADRAQRLEAEQELVARAGSSTSACASRVSCTTSSRTR